MSGGPKIVFVTRQNAQRGITSQRLELDGNSSKRKSDARTENETDDLQKRKKNEDETNEVEVTKTED